VGGAYALYKRDGYGKNLTTGAEHYDKDVQAIRLSAEYKPTDDLFFRLAYDKVEDDSNPRHGHRELPALVGGYKVLDVYDTQAGLGDKNSVKTEGLSLTGEYHASEFLTFKSITAGRKGHTQTLIDFDGTPLPTLDVPATYDDRSFSQELQAVYSDETVQGVFGLYYMNSQASGEFDTIAGNLGVSIADGGKVSTQSFAAFFDVSANFTDRFKISMGARATRDHKRSNTFRFFYRRRHALALPGRHAAADPAGAHQLQRREDLRGVHPAPVGLVRADRRSEHLRLLFEGLQVGRLGHARRRLPDPADRQRLRARNGQRLRGGPEGQSVRPPPVVRLGRVPVQVQGPAGHHPGGRALGHRQLGRQRRRLHPVRRRVRGQGGFEPHLSGTVALGYIHAKYDTFSRFVPAGAPNPVNPSQTIPAGGQIVNVADLYGFQNTPEWTGNASLTWRGAVAGGELRSPRWSAIATTTSSSSSPCRCWTRRPSPWWT
jgi:iron complex outermembrane receptor protein